MLFDIFNGALENRPSSPKNHQLSPTASNGYV